MTEPTLTFADSDSYERFMGQWSRAVGTRFLQWLAAPTDLNWLDVGCGTGILTGLILDHCSPAAVFGIDPQRSQIEHAKRQAFAQRVTLRVARAETLPFSDQSFDLVVSALALNFITDRPRTPTYSPTTRVVNAMPPREREELMTRLRAALSKRQDGHIEYSVAANAVKARVGIHPFWMRSADRHCLSYPEDNDILKPCG